MPDNFDAWLIGAVNRVIDADLAAERLVRDEIKARGTFWAAAEIYKLRRQVAALRKQRDDASQDRR